MELYVPNDWIGTDRVEIALELVHLPRQRVHVIEVNEDNLSRLLEDTKKETENDIEWPIYYFRGEFIGTAPQYLDWVQNAKSELISNDNQESSFMFHSFEDSSVTIASSLLSSKDTDYLISDLSSEFGYDSDISSSTVSQTTHELEQKVDINSINYDGLNSGYYSRAMQYIPSRKILSYLFPSYGENVDELPQDKLLSIIPVLRRNWMYQWQRRKLLFFENCFVRVLEEEDNTNIVREKILYSDVLKVFVYDVNTFYISYTNGKSDYYYSLQTGPFESILVPKSGALNCHIK
mmetsp:Transcript_13004/g.22249  ORF Transcript_13004/g.22249 Transcript_13004/m.22249 type:complete len:292 (+) Transcript_13004:1-876(+)